MPETVTPVPLPSLIAATDISVVATDPPILFYVPFSTVSANSNNVFSVHNWAGPPILKIAVLVLVLLLLPYVFYWVFGRFTSVIRWELDRIAYALGVILFGANRYAAAARSGSGVATLAVQACPWIWRYVTFVDVPFMAYQSLTSFFTGFPNRRAFKRSRIRSRSA